MSSQTITQIPRAAALNAADEILGPNRIWCPLVLNGQQRDWLKFAYKPVKDIIGQIPGIKTIASRSADAINDFLAENGFCGLKIDPFSPDGFGTAAVLDALFSWLQPGEKVFLTGHDGKSYPAAAIKVGLEFGQTRHSNEFCFSDYYAIIVSAKDGYTVTFAVPPIGASIPQAALNNLLYLLSKNGRKALGQLEILPLSKLVFPMIDLQVEENISWLHGLSTTDDHDKFAYISQALQQTRLRMNHLGVRCESAVALGVERLCLETAFEVNRPFFLIVDREDLPYPLMVAYLDYDSWKDPGNFGLEDQAADQVSTDEPARDMSDFQKLAAEILRSRCPFCKGKGKVARKYCGHCQGTGMLANMQVHLIRPVYLEADLPVNHELFGISPEVSRFDINFDQYEMLRQRGIKERLDRKGFSVDNPPPGGC